MADIQRIAFHDDELLANASLFLEAIAKESLALRTVEDFYTLHTKLFSYDIPRSLWFLREAVGINLFFIAKNRCHIEAETSLQEKFRKMIDVLIPGASIIKFSVIPEHIPDFMIQVSGVIMPVEVKREVFNAKACKQLQRYMKAYGAKKGIAVAPRLLCPLPVNIRFIKLAV